MPNINKIQNVSHNENIKLDYKENDNVSFIDSRQQLYINNNDKKPKLKHNYLQTTHSSQLKKKTTTEISNLCMTSI